ncbi:sulfatase [Lentisphaera marina]|uniref:sulfatase family protein n=1 Tax=Lentisphaera marina TaxID=1111041 RepID=UPI00236695B1|nr:sulfatase [Lentisphaera marina]MDD7985237.1 sulfatase [Lentisphaera marina]
MKNENIMKALTLLIFCLIFTIKAEKQTNFLIILADDCTYNDLPIYGGANALTPNIDSLAKEGLTFNQAYVAEAMCAPSRSELYSGLYPFNNGAAWNHSSAYKGLTTMPQDLGALGYRVGLAGKVHVKPKSVFPFTVIEGFDKSCVRNPTQKHSNQGIEQFMSNKDQPFCLVVALVEPHVPWVMGDRTQYPDKKIQLPPNIADTKLTREAFSRYLAEITYMDEQVGDILKSLERSGQKDNTLVIFTSEQGAQFPGCKWTNFNTGLHTAFISLWPGKTPKNKRTDALIQYADVLPTFMDIAGAKDFSKYDGKSFKNVLTGETETHREYVYGIHNNTPEGPPFPIRSISNGKFRYIMNLKHENQFIEKHLMGIKGTGELNNKYWGSWIWESTYSPEIFNLVQRYTNRPKEELYHTEQDEFELKNLADNPEYSSIKVGLKKELEKWLQESGDPGALLDTNEAYQAAKKGEHIYKPKNLN